MKIEKGRIEYCKLHQEKLRVEFYQGIINYLNNRAAYSRANNRANKNMRVGKIVILPLTFIGSPRYMLELYHESINIVRNYRKPDLFITMTCNPR